MFSKETEGYGVARHSYLRIGWGKIDLKKATKGLPLWWRVEYDLFTPIRFLFWCYVKMVY